MNKNILIALAVLAVVGIGTYYFVFNTGSGAPSVYTPPETSVSNTVSSNAASVTLSNFAFSPAQISVKAGTTVTWTNKDSAAHTVTSNTGAFDSKTLNPGATFSFTFTTPGTFTYHCSLHPSMVATVVVTQ